MIKYELEDICENCRRDVADCWCMDGPEDSVYDRKRHGDYDYCGDDEPYEEEDD